MKLKQIKKSFLPATLKLVLLSFIIAVAFYTCKKPYDDLAIAVNTDIIKNSVSLRIFDASDPAVFPTGAKVAIVGQDAAMIYEYAGTKNFTVTNGVLNLGVDPARVPTTASPVKFTVVISAPDYFQVIKDIVIGPKPTSQTISIPMQSSSDLPDGIKTVSQKLNLSAGVLRAVAKITIPGTKSHTNSLNTPIATVKTTQGVKATDSVYYDNGQTTVVLPVGTSFYYYKDNTTNINYGAQPGPDLNAYSALGIPQSYYGLERDYANNTSLTKVKYTGQVTAVLYYKEDLQNHFFNRDESYSAYYDSPQSNRPVSTITLYDKSKVRDDEIIFSSVAKQSLLYILFLGSDGKSLMTVSPDNLASWFSSYTINEGYINPITNQKIKAGDSVEVGIDYDKGKTLRAAVATGRDGYLHVETQSGNFGFYSRAAYIYRYNFTVNPTLTGSPMEKGIPDPENLWMRGFMRFTETNGNTHYDDFNSGFINFPPDNFSRIFTGVILSDRPLTYTAEFYTGYWDKILTKQVSTGLTGSISPYLVQPAVKDVNSLPVANFDIEIDCLPHKIVKPSFNSQIVNSTGYNDIYAGSSNVSTNVALISLSGNVANGTDYRFSWRPICSFKSGLWKTKGLDIGKTYYFTGTLKGRTISTSSVVFSASKTYTSGDTGFTITELGGACSLF